MAMHSILCLLIASIVASCSETPTISTEAQSLQGVWVSQSGPRLIEDVEVTTQITLRLKKSDRFEWDFLTQAGSVELDDFLRGSWKIVDDLIRFSGTTAEDKPFSVTLTWHLQSGIVLRLTEIDGEREWIFTRIE